MKRFALVTCGCMLLGSCQFEGHLHATRLPDGQIEFSVTYDPTGNIANNDLVVMDFRSLTTPNQQIVDNYLRTLPRTSLTRIRIMD